MRDIEMLPRLGHSSRRTTEHRCADRGLKNSARMRAKGSKRAGACQPCAQSAFQASACPDVSSLTKSTKLVSTGSRGTSRCCGVACRERTTSARRFISARPGVCMYSRALLSAPTGFVSAGHWAWQTRAATLGRVLGRGQPCSSAQLRE